MQTDHGSGSDATCERGLTNVSVRLYLNCAAEVVQNLSWAAQSVPPFADNERSELHTRHGIASDRGPKGELGLRHSISCSQIEQLFLIPRRSSRVGACCRKTPGHESTPVSVRRVNIQLAPLSQDLPLGLRASSVVVRSAP